MSLFTASHLQLSFGGIKAVQDVSFVVEQGEVFSIIGPNGAGKTTIFNLISRFYDLDSGDLELDGVDLTRLSAHDIARHRIARTFQNTELFEHETVLQNLLIGCHVNRKTNLISEMLHLPSARRQELQFRDVVEEIIDIVDLQAYRFQTIGSLPYGVRKMVEIARALCLRPKLLLLDEPASGLNPEETEDLSFWIEDINEELGITVLMIEHDMNLVSQTSHRVMAMSEGKVITTGKPADVQSHPEVLAAYLGTIEDVA